MYKAGARKVGNVVSKGEMWIESNIKIADRGIGCEGKR